MCIYKDAIFSTQESLLKYIREGVDAIFSTQDILLKYIREGDNPILCCFNLEKAFDSVEYNTELGRREHASKNGIK